MESNRKTVIDVETGEILYNGMSFTEAVQTADHLNKNENVSTLVYGIRG